jgi:RNA polymerase sigma factor for flagellar operon FliA
MQLMNVTSEHRTPPASWFLPASEDGALRADLSMLRAATPMTKGDGAPSGEAATGGARRLTDAVARKYLVRVVAHARRLARRLPAHVSLGDLISAGMLGVVEGFLRFDPNRAETLDAFLDHRIRGALLDELRRNDPLSRGQRTFARKVDRATRAAAGGASEESLAAALGLGLATFRERVAEVSTAMAIQATGDGLHTDYVPDDGLRPDEALDARKRRTLLAQSAETLSARERELLALHYEHGQNFREIATRFGVSESRISQLHTHAIQQLRARIAA